MKYVYKNEKFKFILVSILNVYIYIFTGLQIFLPEWKYIFKLYKINHVPIDFQTHLGVINNIDQYSYVNIRPPLPGDGLEWYRLIGLYTIHDTVFPCYNTIYNIIQYNTTRVSLSFLLKYDIIPSLTWEHCIILNSIFFMIQSINYGMQK